MPPPSYASPVIDRLADRFDIADDGCWIWSGQLLKTGYGQMATGSQSDGTKRTNTAHRLMYEYVVGPIPDGLFVDHLCCNKACVNPDHLEPVTPAENVRRFVASGEMWQTKKTHCARGHPFDEENTEMYRGSRVCLACRDIWRIARNERRRMQTRAEGRYPNREKTHCRNGHPYDETNTGYWKNTRVCRTCKAAAQRAYQKRVRLRGGQ